MTIDLPLLKKLTTKLKFGAGSILSIRDQSHKTWAYIFNATAIWQLYSSLGKSECKRALVRLLVSSRKEKTGLEKCMTDITDYNSILAILKNCLDSWDTWAFLAKSAAVLIGAVISVSVVLISSKKLDDKWHYGFSALAAALMFMWGMLKPYDEYKQFRAAYAHLEGPYLTLLGTKNTENSTNAIKALAESRELLREDWEPKEPDKL